jgi:hypothetical protein
MRMGTGKSIGLLGTPTVAEMHGLLETCLFNQALLARQAW